MQNWFWPQPEACSSHPAAVHLKQKLMLYEEARWQQSSEQLFLSVIQQKTNKMSPRAHVVSSIDRGKPSFLINSHMAALLSGSNIEDGLTSKVFIDKSLLSSLHHSGKFLQVVTGLRICGHNAPRSPAASITAWKKVILTGKP